MIILLLLAIPVVGVLLYATSPYWIFWLKTKLLGVGLKLGGILFGDVPRAVWQGVKWTGWPTAVTAAGILLAAPLVDAALSLPARQVRTLSENWDLLDQAGREADIDPFMIGATWGVEHSLTPTNPGNGQGIGGFYTLTKVKGYWFPPGNLTDEELYEQLVLIGQQIRDHCPGNASISYESGFENESEEAMWNRAACWARYNGIRGFVRGNMKTAGAVFNNLPGRADLRGLPICLGDGCPSVGPMRNDGYETYYRKIQALIFTAAAAADTNGEPQKADWTASFVRLFNSFRSYGNLTPSQAPINMTPTFSRAPRQTIPSYAALPRPEVGEWGPQFSPLGGHWVATQWDHGASYSASCVDLASTDSKKAPVFAPISGVITAYYDGLGNSALLIENPEWVAVLLHHRRLDVQNGSWINAGQQYGLQGSVGKSTGPHEHYCLYNKTVGSYVQAWRYIPGWPKQ